ncbi:hypothetical protein B0T22DRAFT_62821 [Podospora appendiculata]|uniref:Uncharacterized protein n=1 Tax=Podospora appendiculata TaxID=314037 RepID=A0AAE0XJN7_9PEZI|nr:hypothetical protein B0T22DRAFT_62821 [Podospora appendiculata]
MPVSKRRRIVGPVRVAKLPDLRPLARTHAASRLVQVQATAAAVPERASEPLRKAYTIPDSDDHDDAEIISAQLTSQDIEAWSSTASRSRHVGTKSPEPLSGPQPQRATLAAESQSVDHDSDAASVMSDLSGDFYQDFKSDLCIDITSLRLSITPSDSFDVAGFSRSQTQSLHHALRKWVQQDKPSRALSHVYYRLDNMYHEDGFDTEKYLFGRDLALVRTFKSLGSQTRVDFFLAFLQREEPEAGRSAPRTISSGAW